jgi:histidinol-phosphate aminotransferase
MAEAEGLQAHKMAVTYRLEALKDEEFDKKEENAIELQGKPSFIDLKPYQSARDDFSTESEVTFLDANENPYNSPTNRYPDPHHNKLKVLLADYFKTTARQLLIGNGSDEILDLVMRGFCTPAVHNVQIVDPTYGMYEILARINHIEVEKIPLNNDFSFPIQHWDTSNQKVGLSIICNPNNPTANKVEMEQLEKIIAATEHMILIDEAYIEFSSDSSAIALTSKYDNLMICRTMSKAFGLAGARIGALISNPRTISYLSKLKPPYNCSSLNQNAAIDQLKKREIVQTEVDQIIEQRSILMKELTKLSTIKRVLPTETNFIMVEVEKPNELYQVLIENGFVVRNRSKLHLCKGMLRITVGTENENKRLLQTLQCL